MLLAFLSIQPLGAQAQITTGLMDIRIVDTTGGVMPGATVVVRNVDTGLERTFVSGDNGRVVVPQLQPGRYVVEASMPGFATLRQEDVVLTVGQSLSFDLTMQVSAVQETITVSGTPTVNVKKIESSSTLNQMTIDKTPVLGRKFEDLLTLTPGVSITQGPDGDEINFNGQRGIFNNFSVDGGDFNNGFFGEQVGGQRAAIDITMDAIQEFQVVASGASAEFGRTGGGIVNVITKSGTEEVHGSLFYFQRLEDLTADDALGRPLESFDREQVGGTIGGPIMTVRDRMFYFGAVEFIDEDFSRPGLSIPIGSVPCPVAAPTILNDEALIASNPDCQRLSLLNFFQTGFNQDEGTPVSRTVNTASVLAKWDWSPDEDNQVSATYSFTRSRNVNQTFDVDTFGNSANGIEGPAKIQRASSTWSWTVAPTQFNELHFTYSRENRPRSAVESNLPADVGAGFAPSFRFGNPFFLQPDVDELFWRTQVRNNFTWIQGDHTIKFGGEWVHSNNAQVFRGFFTGRYLFDSVPGFLRFASDASMGPGFGPGTLACADGTFTDVSIGCGDAGATGGPLLFFLQTADRTGPATDAAGFSEISNEDLALFIQDAWQIHPHVTFNYGFRWEAQIMPDVVVPPEQTVFARFLGDPRFPSDGKIRSQKKQWQPRAGIAWDIGGNRTSVLRVSGGIYYARQNMLTQVGSITTNGVQAQTLFANTFLHAAFGAPIPTFPGVLSPPVLPEGEFPLFSGVRVFADDYRNPRVTTFNSAFEQKLFADWSAYVDFTWSKGVALTRFLNFNSGSPPTRLPENGNAVIYEGPPPFDPILGETMVTVSNGSSLYRGVTFGMRKQFSQGFQMDWNYTYSKDKDDDSNERDPFLDRSFDRSNLQKDFGLSDRDIRHRFNLVLTAELPFDFTGNVRFQGHTSQPTTIREDGDGSGPPCSRTNTLTRVVDGIDCGRNNLRKINGFNSLDWRIERAFKWADGRYSIVAIAEMFNTTDEPNFINPLITPGLFNFDGFLRQGVGDPRQLQLAVRFVF